MSFKAVDSNVLHGHQSSVLPVAYEPCLQDTIKLQVIQRDPDKTEEDLRIEQDHKSGKWLVLRRSVSATCFAETMAQVSDLRVASEVSLSLLLLRRPLPKPQSSAYQFG